jgi:ribosomal protein S18 acetylase RimI-like enzyme
MKLTIRPLTTDRWPDLESIFNAGGCSVARGCWCMYYRNSGSQPARAAQRHRAGLQALAGTTQAPGLIGYRDQQPVGWVSLGPREDFAKLRHSPVMKPVDEQPVWSIVCFVVPSAWRGQGVARALLDGAIAYARQRGVQLLEAYPVDKLQRSAGQDMWFGAKAMYDDAGFEEVARRKPTRPVVRLHLR